MTAPLIFSVYGEPQQQGSGRAYTYRRRPEKGGGIGARIEHDNRKLRSWRQLVAEAAMRANNDEIIPYAGPMRLMVGFYMPRPIRLGQRMESFIKEPDLDKLVRAIGDALTGVIYADDKQITQIKCWKKYAEPGQKPRAVISIAPVLEEGVLPYEQ